jgi:hypothetical protein
MPSLSLVVSSFLFASISFSVSFIMLGFMGSICVGFKKGILQFSNLIALMSNNNNSDTPISLPSIAQTLPEIQPKIDAKPAGSENYQPYPYFLID